MSGIIIIGNTARPVTEDRCEWRMFVEAGEHSLKIDKVVLKLHPTFHQNVHELTSCDDHGRFTSSIFSGWGTFGVGVAIHWTSGEVSTLEHELQFRKGGAQSQLTIPAEIPMEEANEMDIEEANQEGASNRQGMSLVRTRSRTQLAAPTTNGAGNRETMEAQLATTPFMEHQDDRFVHGRGYNGPLLAPKKTWSSTQKPRDDHKVPF